MLNDEPAMAHLPIASASRPKLLVVDDQPINIQVLYQLFAADCQVFMATNGAQALQVCRDKRPDLVLLDVVMPGMDGYEVCRQLKADETLRHIPVIFVTAHDDPEQETMGLDLGAVDFIAKPVNPKVVQARVKTQLTLKFQADLLESVKQMRRGKAGRVTKVKLPAAAEARASSGLSQQDFAKLLGVSARTLQDWEQGRREPTGAARTLLKVAVKHPKLLRELQ